MQLITKVASFLDDHYTKVLYTDYLTTTPKDKKLQVRDLVLTIAKSTDTVDQTTLQKAKVLAKLLQCDDPKKSENVRKIEELKQQLIVLDPISRNAWKEHVDSLMKFSFLANPDEIEFQIESVRTILNDIIGPQEDRTEITDLPPEVLTNIFMHCPKNAIGALTRTCHQFKQITDDKHFKRQYFSLDPNVKFLLQHATSIEDIYRFETKIKSGFYDVNPVVPLWIGEAPILTCQVTGDFLVWQQIPGLIHYMKIGDTTSKKTIETISSNISIVDDKIFTVNVDKDVDVLTVKTLDISTNEELSSVEISCKVLYSNRSMTNWKISNGGILYVETGSGCEVWRITDGVRLFSYTHDTETNETFFYRFYDGRVILFSDDQNASIIYPQPLTLENTKGYIPVLQQGHLLFFLTPMKNIAIFDANTGKQEKMLVMPKHRIKRKSQFCLIGDILFWTYKPFNQPHLICSYNIRKDAFENAIEDPERNSYILEKYNESLVTVTSSGISMIEFQSQAPGLCKQITKVFQEIITFLKNI